MSTAPISWLLGSSRSPIQPPDSSREFVDEILGELAASRWSARGWAGFLARSSARSWQQFLGHPRAALEITVAHSLLFAGRPRLWTVTSWVMAVTHLGLLGDARDGLGWANRLSLLRANLPAVVGPPSPWTAIAALTTDWADGWLARRGDDTAFGGYADVLADVAFWTWYVRHHEPSPTLRTLAMVAWLGPAAAITAAYFVVGRAVVTPRPTAVRNLSVALQVLVSWRALRRPRRRSCAKRWPAGIGRGAVIAITDRDRCRRL